MTISPTRRSRHAADEAARPATDETARPATDQTARPATDQTAHPAADKTARPAADQTARPATDQTARLATDQAPRPAAERVDRRPAEQLLTADEVVGEVVAPGVDDATARARSGMSLRGLGVSALTHLHQRRAQRGLRRAPARRPYLRAAALRCALYLGPLSVAIAATGSLGRVGWIVPVATLVLGWSAAQALTGIGASVARGAGPAAAARLVGGGFVTAAGLWCAFVWMAPAAWLGSRPLACVIGIGGLTALATVTAALVTRAEADVVRWSLPCWLLGALNVAAALGNGWAVAIPVETLLPAALVAAVVRAYRPVIGRSVPGRRPLAAADVRRGAGYLVLGAAQAACVAMLWRAGTTETTAPAAIPLLLAVPALETLVGWHMHQVDAGPGPAESGRELRRHVHSVAVTTVSALLPPLAAGIALTAAAYRLPYAGPARDGVLALAAGTLLGGLLAATALLAARGRTAVAASLAVAAPTAVVALPPLAPALGPLPAAVAVFAGAHLLGLLAVAHTAADHRRSL